jgi:hypothetical protein
MRAASVPWWVMLIVDASKRSAAPTAIEDALFHAVEKALYAPHHPLHLQTFGYYERAPAPRLREEKTK